MNKPTTNGQTETVNVTRAALAIVHISEHNTRHPKPAEVTELTQSMKQFGQTTPAIGRPHPKKPGHIELAAGARRRVAAEAAGLEHLDVIVKEMDDNVFEETILIENLQREDPDPRAEVKLLDRLVKRGMNASAISAHLGKPQHWVTRRLKLLDVIPELRKEWERTGDRGLGIQHYTVEMMSMLGSLPKATQESFIARDQYKRFENDDLDCINTATDLRKYLDQDVACLLSTAPFDLNDPKFFVKGCGPGCASDSSKQGALFDFGQTPKDARCLNCPCFSSRVAKWRKHQLDQLGITKETRFIVDKEHSHNDEIQIGSQTYDVTARGYYATLLTKPPTKGKSEKVIVVDERGTKFRVGYLTPRNRAYSDSTTRQKKPKASLETRKKILQSRRWNVVREKLIDLVLASKVKDVTVDPIDLVPIFGFGFNCAPLRSDKYKNKLWTRFDDRKKAGFEMPRNEETINKHICGNYMHRTIDRWSQRGTVAIKDRNEAIWHGLKHVIIDQLLHFRLASEIIGERGDYDIERIGALIGFDTKTAKREADLQIQPPRTWGKVDVHTLEPLTAKDALKSLRKKVAKK